jgi:hypothetical protein
MVNPRSLTSSGAVGVYTLSLKDVFACTMDEVLINRECKEIEVEDCFDSVAPIFAVMIKTNNCSACTCPGN